VDRSFFLWRLRHNTRPILIIILVIVLLGGFSGRFGGYGYGYGYRGIGIVGAVLTFSSYC
jgi:Protein of unknown function (DUF3309)